MTTSCRRALRAAETGDQAVGAETRNQAVGAETRDRVVAAETTQRAGPPISPAAGWRGLPTRAPHH
jgi:hypothetical protein